MAFKNETPLRGWKEILPLLGTGGTENGQVDRRTAMKILREKNLLHYEGRTPVLLASEYLQTLKMK